MMRFRNFFKTFWAAARLGWVGIVVTAGVFYIWSGGSELLRSQFGVLSWKLVLLGTALAIAHLTRRQIFDYLDLSAVLDRTGGQEPHPHAGLIFLGVAVYYVGIVLALCSGL